MLLSGSSYTSCDSLQNRFVLFEFAITFHKIFGFPLEATLSIFLIIHIQFKDVSNQRKSEAWSRFLYNKAQPTPKCNLCAIIQKEVAQAPTVWAAIWIQSTESMRVKTTKLFGTGRDLITNCDKGNESFWGYKKEVKNNLENCSIPWLQSSPNQCNQGGLFQLRDFLSQNSETDWMMKMCCDCHASV